MAYLGRVYFLILLLFLLHYIASLVFGEGAGAALPLANDMFLIQNE